MGIGKRIKWLRGALTRHDFGSRIGVGKTSIQNYETGDRTPKGDVLQALQKEFSVSIDWLLTGRGEPYVREADAGGFEDGGVEGLDGEGLNGPTGEYEIEGRKFRVSDFERQYAPQAVSDPFTRAISAVREIFDSGDPVLIHVLQANLHAFQHSARQSRQIRDLQRRLEILEKKLVLTHFLACPVMRD